MRTEKTLSLRKKKHYKLRDVSLRWLVKTQQRYRGMEELEPRGACETGKIMISGGF